MKESYESGQLMESILRSLKIQKTKLEGAPFPILILEPKSEGLLFANNRAIDYFGLKKISYGSLKAGTLFLEKGFLEHMNQLLHKEIDLKSYETRLRDHKRGGSWALIAAVSLPYEDKDAVLIMISDIHRRKLHECYQRVTELLSDMESPFEKTIKGVLAELSKAMTLSRGIRVSLDWDGRKFSRGRVGAPVNIYSSEVISHGDQRILLTLDCDEASSLHLLGPLSPEKRKLLDHVAAQLNKYAENLYRSAKLREKQDLLQIMFEQTKDAVALFDPLQNRFVDCNTEAHQGLGYTKEEFLKMGVSDLQAQHSDREIKENIDGGLQGELEWFDTIHKTKDGRLRDCRVKLTPLIYEGKPFLTAVWRDITEYKQLEKERQERESSLGLHTTILAKISQMQLDDQGDIGTVISEILALVSETLSIDRVSFWRADTENDGFECQYMYVLGSGLQNLQERITNLQFGGALKSLYAMKYYVHDDSSGEADKALLNSYLEPRKMKRLMAYPVSLHGITIGFFGISTGEPGSWNPHEISFAGQIAGAISALFLTKERWEAVAQLRLSEKFLRWAQEVSKTGHWHLDIPQNKLIWSEETYKIFHVPLGTPMSLESFAESIHPDDKEMVMKSWGSAIEGETYHIVHRICAGDEIKWLEERAEIELDPFGRPVTGLGTVQDVTEKILFAQELDNCRKNLEAIVEERTRQLVDAKNLAEEANKAKSLFLSNISHEIRTPMNAIVNYAYLIQRDPLNANQQDYIKKITAASKNLLQIINDVLDFSKIESGKLSFESQTFELSRIYDYIYGLVAGDVQAKGIEVVIDLEAVPWKLRGDSVRLGQILLNLLANAVKFTQTGFIYLRAWELERYESYVIIRFEVEDTGIGISEEQINRLFSEFEQADNSTTRLYGGTGLGLAISRKLTTLMGGQIGVNSLPGQGSTFWLEIPFELPEPSEEDSSLKQHFGDIQAITIDCDQEKPLDMESAIRLREQREISILLVEDNLINQDVVARLLQTTGIHVEIASNGQEAIEKIRSKDFDLVFMDVQMPVMDGYEATEKIRKMKRGISLPIIAMTANAFEDDKKKAFSIGMNDYLSKPVEPNDLFACLIKWIPGKMSGGLDWAAGVKAIGGNPEQYIRLLGQFFDQHESEAHEMLLLLEGGDLQGLSRILHNWKGSSGILALTRIYEITSSAYILSMNGEGNKARLLDLITRLAETFNRQSEEFKKFLYRTGNPGRKDEGYKGVEILDEIEKHLENYDARASESYDKNRDLILEFYPHQGRVLGKLIDNFEYADALDFLRTKWKRS